MSHQVSFPWFWRCKGREIFVTLQTFLWFFDWVIATGGRMGDKHELGLLDLSCRSGIIWFFITNWRIDTKDKIKVLLCWTYWGIGFASMVFAEKRTERGYCYHWNNNSWQEDGKCCPALFACCLLRLYCRWKHVKTYSWTIWILKRHVCESVYWKISMFFRAYLESTT